MSSPMETTLYSTAARTFEELAFMFPEPPDDPESAASPDAGVCVVFHGPISGRVELRVSQGILHTVATNMLGEDENLPRNQQLDALGEIGNVICGNVLPAITDAKKVFHLDAPRVLTDTELLNPRTDSAAAIVPLQMDEGAASVHLFIESLPN